MTRVIRPLTGTIRFWAFFTAGTTVPEWGGVEVSMGLEDQAVVLEAGARLLDGYPRSLYLIRQGALVLSTQCSTSIHVGLH